MAVGNSSAPRKNGKAPPQVPKYIYKIENGSKKSQQHPKDFPGGPPPQYYPGLATVNFGVRKRSGVFVTVWPSANIEDVELPG